MFNNLGIKLIIASILLLIVGTIASLSYGIYLMITQTFVIGLLELLKYLIITFISVLIIHAIGENNDKINDFDRRIETIDAKVSRINNTINSQRQD